MEEEARQRIRVTRHILILFVLIALLLLINGKWYFSESRHYFLFTYGLTITIVVFFTFFLTYLLYRDPSKQIRKRDLHKNLQKPFISCVVAVYNEPAEIIKKCIGSLVKSSYKNREIIVVNDGSTDNTKEVLDTFRFYEGVNIIHLEKNVGKKRAIAAGLLQAKGEIFIFTDSDSVVAEDAIERLVEIFASDPSVGAVSGHARALNAQKNLLTKIQDAWYETQFSVEKALESAYGAVTCVSGPLAAFRREAIYNFIPAWEQDTFLGEEFKFATDRQLTGYVLGSRYIGKRLKEKYATSPFVQEVDYPLREWKILYCKSARVLTVVPDTFKRLVKQQVRWKKSFLRNLFFTGKFYWRKPVIPAAKYYLGAFFTLLGPLIVFRHLVYLPMNGSSISGVLYLSGIFFIGSLYAIAYKTENPKSQGWIYRPLMSFLSTLILSWLLFYSALTIKKKRWSRS